eukprot:TRINITY_DN79255_c0_g1_i1.p1 TRINITY_DN79255_c0_g1~~TRINITY_DN79255_c0_g1_i1.p1  ORF type:complete len:220 (+),score=49.69 TRINITY_DN79255_c0_g1_i1:44-703(+)
MASNEPLANGRSVDDRGIPLKSDYPNAPVPVLYVTFTTVFTAIAVAIGLAVFHYGPTEKYAAKIAILREYDLGWMYLGFFIVKVGGFCINMNLGVARKAAKINVPDQQVYKVHTPDGAPELGYVLMEKEGVLGKFNRAQRAYMNYLEQAPVFVAYFLMGGFVFSFPTFVAGVCFSVARLTSAIGYTHSPNGRMAGNIFGGLCMGVLEGFVLIAGVKAVL